MVGFLRTFEAPGLFRLLLALAVFVNHATRLNLGSAAVYIFFMLSGYWASKIWTDRYSRARFPCLTYAVSRAWRLIPVFILCSAIAWAVAPFGANEIPAPLDWIREAISSVVIFGYQGLVFKPIVPAWSLDVEAQFYIIAPLVAGLLTRSMWWIAGIAAVSIAALANHDAVTAAPYLIFFAIGAATSVNSWRPDVRLAWGVLITAAVVIALVLIGPFRSILLIGSNPGPLAGYNGLANVVVALLLAPWALFTTGRKGSARDGMYGDLSYVVYLLHWPILQIVFAIDTSVFPKSAALAVALAVTLCGAWLIWKFVDHPLNRMRSRWVSGRIADGRQAIFSSAGAAPKPMT